MKLLYVSGLYVPASGGAEISAHSLLLYLTRQGHQISVVTGPMDSSSEFDDNAFPGITIIRLPGAFALEAALEAILDCNPDVRAIMAQNSWSDLAMKHASRRNVPSIFFLRGLFGELDVSIGGPNNPRYVVANSPQVKQYLVDKWGRTDAIMVPPFIDLEDYISTEVRPRTFITMVNPIKIKGGEIVEKVAASMPQHQFLIVQGWGHLRKPGGWNLERLFDLARGFDVAPSTLKEPDFLQEPDFSSFMNVKVQPPTRDMRKVYEITRILLVPSLVIEGMPRVAVEALANGIPVIGSAYGVRQDVIGSGGIRVVDHSSPIAWIEAISMLDDREVYTKMSWAAQHHASQYDPAKGARPLLEILARCTT